MNERNWIVITGQLVDSTTGGGFEFYGPYSEEEAKIVREQLCRNDEESLALAVQLLTFKYERREK